MALSDDGGSLILTSDDTDGGEERFELPIDERVRAAARGDARLGAIEDLGNTLPAAGHPGAHPGRRDARAGRPGLGHPRGPDHAVRPPGAQERARIAEQASEARVRLSEGTPGISLQRFMTERLRLLGADIEAVRWDAHRGDDGTWVVTGAWRAGEKSGTTLWSFDIPARMVSPFDAATTRLRRGHPAGPRRARRPRRAAAQPTACRRPCVAPLRPRRDAGTDEPSRRSPRAGADRPAGRRARPRRRPAARDAGRRAGSSTHSRRSPSTTPSSWAAPASEPDAEDPRARVPAWEDIVFGVRRHR